MATKTEKKQQKFDPARLPAAQAAKMLGELHRLGEDVQNKRVLYELAKDNAKSAKETLEAAQEALEAELAAQSADSGPLFEEGA